MPERAEFDPRYRSAVHKLSKLLWRRYPEIDPADKDNAMDETMNRLAQFERKNGEAKDLSGLVVKFFRQALSRTVFSKSYYKLQPLVRPAHIDDESDRLGSNASATSVYQQVEANQLLRNLDERTRMVLYLRFIEELSSREIAVKLGLTESNVRKIIHRAREKANEGAPNHE